MSQWFGNRRVTQDHDTNLVKLESGQWYVDGVAVTASASSINSSNTLLNGSGAPSAGLGADGDFYIDTSANAIYGPKTAGSWGSGTALGASGTKIFRTSHTFALAGGVVNATMPSAFVSLGAGQASAIVGAYCITSSGTATVNVTQNGSSVSGLGSLSATSSSGFTAATVPPSIAAGDKLGAVITAAASCFDLSISIILEHTV